MQHYFYRTGFESDQQGLEINHEARNTMANAGVPIIPGSQEAIYDAAEEEMKLQERSAIR